MSKTISSGTNDPDDEQSTERQAQEFAYFLYHPDTTVVWWKPEDEFILNGVFYRRRYQKLEAKNNGLVNRI